MAFAERFPTDSVVDCGDLSPLLTERLVAPPSPFLRKREADESASEKR
jgi:hypothetical protein